MSAKQINVLRWDCQCEKCKNQWQTRTPELPKICPVCKSRRWLDGEDHRFKTLRDRLTAP